MMRLLNRGIALHVARICAGALFCMIFLGIMQIGLDIAEKNVKGDLFMISIISYAFCAYTMTVIIFKKRHGKIGHTKG